MTLGSARRRTIASCLFVAAVSSALAAARTAEAQEQPKTERVTTGPEYGAGGFHRAMLGSSYRDLWTTPDELPVLDLSKEGGGGLKPVRRVGGQQTRAWRSWATTDAPTPFAAWRRTRRTSCRRSCTTPSSRACCATRWRRSTRRAR